MDTFMSNDGWSDENGASDPEQSTKRSASTPGGSSRPWTDTSATYREQAPEDTLLGDARRRSGFGPEVRGAPRVYDSATEEDPEQNPHGGCVFIGPSNAGKTTLLGGLLQACLQPPDHAGDYELHLLSEDLDELLQGAHSSLMTGRANIDPTNQTQVYRFGVGAIRPSTFWRPAQHLERLFTIWDGRGGDLFPAEHDRLLSHGMPQDEQRLLLQQAQQAHSLVLCVDASDPQLGLLLSRLPGLLGRLSRRDLVQMRDEAPFWDRIPWLRTLTGRRQRMREQNMRRLEVKRLLLLLTKIDRLVLNAPKGPGLLSDMLGQPAGVTPARLAESIDPVEQAISLLGSQLLYQLSSALKPDASLAVGLVSTWGFDARNGQPFMRPPLTPGTPAAAQSICSEDELKYWQPFGIRDALIYLLTGKIQGTVKKVETSALYRSSHVEHLPVEALRGGITSNSHTTLPHDFDPTAHE